MLAIQALSYWYFRIVARSADLPDNPCQEGNPMKAVILAMVLATASAALGAGPRVYIQPDGGYESYLAAAIIKKHVPVTVTTNKANADYVLVSHVISHEESSLAKLARAAFLAGMGMDGKQTATVELVRASDGSIIWAYNVHKGRALKYQSTAEAAAKHLKSFLRKNP
jgi:hypothetical protein